MFYPRVGIHPVRGRAGRLLLNAVDVVNRIDAAHGAKQVVEDGWVANLKHEAAQGYAVGASRDARRKNVHVVLGQHTSHI